MKKSKPTDFKKELRGTVVLITGGTGSFGGVVLERLLAEGCAEVRVFSRDEKKQFDMNVKYAGKPLKFYIGDVRDRDGLIPAMRGVDYVFHAAALKQVPTGEFFPDQVVKTNILGSTNVMEVAIENEVKKVVCLSTDKAVMPVNAMGMSKALMEKQLQAMVRKNITRSTTLCLVRYGNVMCSRGSVISLFMEQIKAGNPITVTDGNMTRFMLPLRDAVDLVLYAMESASPGDLLIKKSPACTVRQLANVLMRIFGKKVPIKTIGMRLGEKIDESLASASEIARAIDTGSFLRIPLETTDLNYEKYFSQGALHLEDFNSRNAVQLSDSELEALLLSLPEVQDSLAGLTQEVA